MNTFLCRRCQSVMCDDCQSNAEEYTVLYGRQKAYLHKAQQEIESLQRDLDLARRSRDDYKHMLELGIGPQMLAWMRSLSPAKLRAAIERESQL